MEEGVSKQSEFIYFVEERERIRLRKEKGEEKPWTTDQVFWNTYFCNINRENDRVTRWIRNRWNEHHEPVDMEQATANMIMARIVNKPDSLDRLNWPWGVMHDSWWNATMSQSGSWGSAYIVSTNGNPMRKHEYMLRLLRDCYEQKIQFTNGTTLATAHKQLVAVNGLGSFMAAQVIADLKNTPNHVLQSAEDWASFSAHGPGSLRGLSWFWGYKVRPSNYQNNIDMAWDKVSYAVNRYNLCMQDFQNCFCEFDKYMRVKTGTGRSKRKYNGNNS